MLLKLIEKARRCHSFVALGRIKIAGTYVMKKLVSGPVNLWQSHGSTSTFIGLSADRHRPQPKAVLIHPSGFRGVAASSRRAPITAPSPLIAANMNLHSQKSGGELMGVDVVVLLNCLLEVTLVSILINNSMSSFSLFKNQSLFLLEENCD